MCNGWVLSGVVQSSHGPSCTPKDEHVGMKFENLVCFLMGLRAETPVWCHVPST